MRMIFAVAALAAFAGTACTSSDSSSSASSGGGLSATECRAVVDKSRELSGMPSDVFADASEQLVQQCAANGKLTRTQYDCALSATSTDALRACRIDGF